MQESSGDSHAFPHLVIDFNKEWELQNWYTACTKKSDYGLRGGDDYWFRELPEAAIKAAQNAKSEEEGIKTLRPIFEEFIKTPEAKKTIEESIVRAEREWRNRGEKFFSALSAMLEIPMGKFEKEYHAHLTFTRRCPFDKNGFMFSRFGRIENTATHEIMHIEFLKAYMGYCKERGLTNSEIQHFKEILTVLLDEDKVIRTLRSHRNPGYAKHQEIRPKILKLYQKNGGKNGSFKNFLDKAVPLVKQAKFA